MSLLDACAAPNRDCNLLVISDLHLGEDLKQNRAVTSVSQLRRCAKLERELESFFTHHAQHRLDGRPWRLVVNGDMVDFMSVMILPGPRAAGARADCEGEGSEPVSDEERLFGLACAEWQTVRKLDRVFERHPGVFVRLAEFVAAGNELVIVVGNHDVEFHYPAVQRRFTERLLGCLPTGAESAREQLAERVRFCPWFYYEEELVYVEHGHQYDEYCSFDYQLHPVDPKGGVALSIAHAGIRYFANLVPSIDPAVGEQWGLFDYLRWAAGHGARSAMRLFYLYGLMVWKVAEVWRVLTDVRQDANRRERHQVRLCALAAKYRLAVDKVQALDGLRCVPVVKRLGGWMKALFVDRLLVGFTTLVALAVVEVVAPGWWKLGGGVALVGGCAGANAWLSLGRMQPVQKALRRAPEAIRRILRAPFIVFGHSHFPEAIPLAGGGTYFNTGAWAGDDLGQSFTHLVIVRGAEPRAELRQWRGGESAPFAVPPTA